MVSASRFDGAESQRVICSGRLSSFLAISALFIPLVSNASVSRSFISPRKFSRKYSAQYLSILFSAKAFITCVREVVIQVDSRQGLIVHEESAPMRFTSSYFLPPNRPPNIPISDPLKAKEVERHADVGSNEHVFHCKATKYPCAWCIPFSKFPYFIGLRIKYLDVHMAVLVVSNGHPPSVCKAINPSAKLAGISAINLLSGSGV